MLRDGDGAGLKKPGNAGLTERAGRSQRQLRVAEEIRHVLAQVLNLYVGGTCIEDVAHLQHPLAEWQREARRP